VGLDALGAAEADAAAQIAKKAIKLRSAFRIALTRKNARLSFPRKRESTAAPSLMNWLSLDSRLRGNDILGAPIMDWSL
jgi:hypothetical protein